MGVVIKKTTPSLQAYPQSYKQKWKMLFFGGFPREKGESFFFFPKFLRLILEFSHSFSIFLPIFLFNLYQCKAGPARVGLKSLSPSPPHPAVQG